MSKSTILPPAPPPPIEPIDLKDALEERYLAYALSTIMHRALPDVRDGLKPVHRRILYAMRELRLDPTGAYKKCAKVVGDVMGNYHPHGDQAIYDAMVRLAQDFAVRYPLVDGQGNFGNVDGDNPAAMRYTESRMTAAAGLLLDGIDEDTVDFRPTYDGENQEPVVLPANFPNLLANGTSGIAVGMATSIPPHNVEELCNALLHLIKHPSATIDKLVEFVPGPDFPTGGIIVEPREQILEAYKTGRGGFRLRARWEKEETGRGTYQIVVTEIPYQVQKAKLVERLAELIEEQEAAPAGRRPRRVGRDHPPGAGAQEPHRRPHGADGEPVQAHRAGGALLPQHERADGRADSARALAARRAAALARPPPGGAGAALPVPAAEDRASPGGAGRLPDRLPQPRRGDPHRPLRGRSQGQADRALQALRGAGRCDPEPALEGHLEARRDRDQGRARPALQGAARSQVAAQVGGPAVGAHRRRGEGDARGLLQEDRARAAVAAASPMHR